ncbi:MAG: N-acetylneuraminate synthase family protein [Candidatus Nanoarchaeia archaeon]|nr:N-acetylneuraminate synthase family protein [Candidatus Nanoarchaeia archaeon]
MNTILVSEIGINANGSLEIAKKLIDLAVLSNCKFVKFQKRTVEAVYTKAELDKPRESPWGTTNREQKMGLEFGKKEYDEIDRYCKEKGIGWFASPWDIDSVDFLMQYNPKYIKVASAMVTNEPLLKKINEAIKGTQTKVIIATGMTTETELFEALSILGNNNIEYILACTSSYPTPVKDMNMAKIATLQAKFLGTSYKIGFSNHYSGLKFIFMAATLGARMIEYHITLDRTIYGSDQASSIEPSGVLEIPGHIEMIENAWGNGKLECMPSELPIKEKLRKK